MSTDRARPHEHDRRPTVDKNGRAVSGSKVNKGVPKTRRLMSQRERELYATQSEALKDLSAEEQKEEKKYLQGRFMPNRDRGESSAAPPEPPETISEKISQRPVPVSLDDLVTLEDLGNLEGYQNSNAIWSTKDADIPIRVTRILDEVGPNGERYARVTGSNTAVPVDEIVFLDENLMDDITQTDFSPPTEKEEVGEPQDFSHLPPPPSPFAHLPSPPASSAPPQPNPFAPIVNSDKVQSIVKEYPLLKHLPRVAVSFGAAVVAFNVAAAIIPAAALGSAVTLMAISGGALIPEVYRMLKVKLSPEWSRFQAVSGWNKRQCSRWEKAGFSPSEALEWDKVFSGRPGLRPGQHRPGGGSAETVLAANFKNVFDVDGGVTAERAAPYIHAWMTPQDILTWQQYGVTSDEDMKAAVALHAAASAEKGGGRVPAYNLAETFFTSRNRSVPTPSNDNILFTEDTRKRKETPADNATEKIVP